MWRRRKRRVREEPSQRLLHALDAGSEIVGAAAGGASSIFVGPIAGATTGAVVARTLRHIGNEVTAQFLSPREEARVGGVLNVAATEIRNRLDRGEEPRGDGFFGAPIDTTGRTAAEELLEGVVREAAAAHEERKVPYLAHLYATAVFDISFTGAELNLLLKLFERTTYRGLVLLVTVARDDFRPELEQRRLNLIAAGNIDAKPSDLTVAELDALAAANLIGVKQESGAVAYFASVMDGGTFRPFIERAKPTPLGNRLHHACRLEDIPEADRLDALNDLAGRNPS